MNELRRGVLAFDIAANIPPGSTITAVSLSLNMSRTPTNTAYSMELHKLLADWGEGTSMASGEEGDGAPATPNDRNMAAPFLRHHFLEHPRRRFFCDSKRNPDGWCNRSVHVELSANGCRCAGMVG